jgi:hypothetical protein
VLNSDQEKALGAIAAAPQAWCSEALLRKAGHEVSDLNALARLGWVEFWGHDKKGTPLTYGSWALTPWAAVELGLIITEVKGIAVWATEEDERPVIAQKPRRERRLPWPKLVAQPKKAQKTAAQYFSSSFWGETTDDPLEAETLLGAPVKVVERL